MSGRHRLPSDVVNELMHLLAAQPRVVVCDLSGMSESPQNLVDAFSPVEPYLAHWPGTLVVACVPEPDAFARRLSARVHDRMLVHASCEDGLAEAYGLLQPLGHTTTHLPPASASVPEARAFTSDALATWGLSRLVDSAALVVDELVTHSMQHAKTVLRLSLSQCENRVRVGVQDHGGGRPSLPTGDLHEEVLDGRGLLLVEAFTRCWGVLPARLRGKTVWAVMDAA